MRPEYPGAIWHLMSRGNNCDIVRTDEDRRLLLALIGDAARRFGWIVYAYCLMTNHFHLVIRTPSATLSSGAHWLLGKYASAFNKRHRRRGHLFQGRFKSVLVEEQDYLARLLRYVVRNPVAARMVRNVEDYEWSSYAATSGLVEAPSWLAVDKVLGQFEPDDRSSQQRFIDYCNQNINEPFLLKQAVAGLYLGSAAWIASLRPIVDARLRSDDHPAAQRYASWPRMMHIIDAVAAESGIDAESIRRGHGGDERTLASWLASFEGMLPRREIAAGLHLRSSGHVSNLIDAFDARLDHDARLRVRVDRCCILLRGSPAGTLPLVRTNH